MDHLRFATRTSLLALAQTALVERWLTARAPGVRVHTIPLATTGDRQADWSLQDKGGKGLFTKELEEALLAGEADVAIHSTKDLPTEMPPGLCLAGFLPRERAHDVLIVREGVSRPGRIATGSPRRRTQLARFFPDVEWSEIRGNVATRLRKIADGACDASVLAAAGLCRLGIDRSPGLIFHPIPLEQCVPAPGQGAIAVQSRIEDRAHLAPFLDTATARAVALERHFLERLGGGCQVAHAAHACDDRLLVFHEKCGYRSFVLARGSETDAYSEIDRIIEEAIR